MSISTVTHLNFGGQAREALEFYRSVFGGQVMIATYADFGMPAEVPGSGDVVWGQVVADNGFTVMAYDVPAQHRTERSAPVTRREQGTTITDQPFFVSVRGGSVDEVEVLWKGLAEGATVVEPFGPAQWAPAFGMLTDRVGVTWIVDVAASY